MLCFDRKPWSNGGNFIGRPTKFSQIMLQSVSQRRKVVVRHSRCLAVRILTLASMQTILTALAVILLLSQARPSSFIHRKLKIEVEAKKLAKANIQIVGSVQ
jgi:hypothetical protein